MIIIITIIIADINSNMAVTDIIILSGNPLVSFLYFFMFNRGKK